MFYLIYSIKYVFNDILITFKIDLKYEYLLTLKCKTKSILKEPPYWYLMTSANE